MMMKILTYIFSLSFSLLIVINSMWVSVNYLYYELDPVGFIERLCENKDAPELECNGKCHLKKVAQSQNTNQKSPENIIDFKELLLFVQFNDINYEKLNYQFRNAVFVSYKNLYTFRASSEFFHPPRFA